MAENDENVIVTKRPLRNKTPTEIVIGMQQQKKDDSEIVAALTEQGVNPNQIVEAFNQARIKQAVVAKPEVPMPAEGLAPSILTTEGRQTEQAQAPEEYYPAPVSGQMQEQSYGYSQQQPAAVDTEAIEEIAESIINEKWEEARAKISSIAEWKDYTENRLGSMEERNKRVEKALDSLQAALLGKVQQYGQDIKSLNTEMKSIEGAFSKLLSPLSANIQELQKITGKMGQEKKSEKKK